MRLGTADFLIMVVPIAASVWAGVATISASKTSAGIRAVVVGALTALLGWYFRDFWGSHPISSIREEGMLAANAQLLTGIVVVGVGVLSVSRLSRGKASSGATTQCPHCAESILTEARVCKHCGREVSQ